MGDGFFRNCSKSYKRSLKEKMEKNLPIGGLFAPTDEHDADRYPCTLREQAECPSPGDDVYLHLPENAERIAVVRGRFHIASIDGDAGKFLRRRFLTQPELCRIALAKVVKVSADFKHFEVQAETCGAN